MKNFLWTTFCAVLLSALLMPGLVERKLEAGDGKGILQSRCILCHDAGRIQRAEYGLDGWKSTVDRMMGKPGFGPKLSEAELQVLLDHLTSR